MNSSVQSPDVIDVILRGGATLRLRPPGKADADAFFAGLSAESMHSRFHGGRRVDRTLVEHFLTDADDRGALVGVVAGEADRERVVAVAEYARLRDPTTAEVAFAVADALQGHGIGARLLERLAALAARAGVERFVAEVLPANRAMLRVFADAGFEVTREFGGGEVEVRFSIAPTAVFRAVSTSATTWPLPPPYAPSSGRRRSP